MNFPDATSTEEISPQFLHELRTNHVTFRLIDCRERDEWDFNRIDGAKLVALSTFHDHAPQLLACHDQAMVIYCHHGIRSLHATRWLRQHGLTNVFSLSGGIDQWSREIDDLVPLY